MHCSPRVKRPTRGERGGGANAGGVADPAEGARAYPRLTGRDLCPSKGSAQISGPTFHAADKGQAALSLAERISRGDERGTGRDKARMKEERREDATHYGSCLRLWEKSVSEAPHRGPVLNAAAGSRNRVPCISPTRRI